jgi:methyl-accepting chemotaxis protein
MLNGFSLSAKLYLGFASITLIAAALGGFAFTRLVAIDKSVASISTDAIPGITVMNQVNSLAKDNMRWTTAAILAENKAETDVEIEKIRQNVEVVNKLFKEYEAGIWDARDRELFEATKEPLTAFREIRKEVLTLAEAQKSKEAVTELKTRLRPAYKKYEESIEALVDYNVKSANQESAQVMGMVHAAKTGIVMGLTLALALAGLIGFFLSRSISSALNGVISALSAGSQQVSAASSQLSQSSQQMAEGASEQASSLEETSASLEEMASMTKQNTDSARQADTMATRTREAVEKSREAMTRMGDAIQKIKGSSDQTAKIVKTIDEIAFQTNLLALNAAVEAARAGDAGKGFAVVAEEVRNLAQRSAEAAKSTATLIEESQQNANHGVAVSSEVAGMLTGIVESVRKLTQLIGEVSAASGEQSKGIEQIGSAVTEMDKLTQSNASNAEESAAASEQLYAQAKELSDMVGILIGIVKGSGAGTEAAASGSNGGRANSDSGGNGKAVSQAAFAKTMGKTSASPDWSPRPAAKGRPRPAVVSGSRVAARESVIPLDDSELRDF